LAQSLLIGFEPTLSGRKREARGQASEASADQFDFLAQACLGH